MVAYSDRQRAAVEVQRSVLCVGIDPQIGRIAKLHPDLLRRHGVPILDEDRYDRWQYPGISAVFLDFGRRVIAETAEFASAFKPQSAFFERWGSDGVRTLETLMTEARATGLPVILDGKRNDGGDTAKAYAGAYQGSNALCDALTVNGSIGTACVEQFIAQMKQNGGGIFILAKTTFKPNSEVEQLPVLNPIKFIARLQEEAARGAVESCRIAELIREHSQPAWEKIARLISVPGELVPKGQEPRPGWGAQVMGECGYSSVGAVVGATYDAEMVRARQLMPTTWFLVPGYGSQGGGADEAVLAADEDGFGITVNSSRGILYPEDGNIAAAARAARDDLNAALLRAGKGKAFL